MPRLSDSMEDGIIVQWLVAEGDRIEAGHPIVEIETDKATVTYEADSAGTILSLRAAAGDAVPIGRTIALIGEPGEEAPAPASRGPAAASPAPAALPHPAPAAPAPAAPAAPAPAAPASTGAERPKASPLARRLASELGVELSGLTGSGPGGRVTRADVEQRATPSVAAAPSSSAKGEATVQELTRVQQTVARRMAESRATVPDIELRVEVDMSESVALRERLRTLEDPAPTINDLIVMAAARALREFPRVNGAYRDGRFELFSRVNVGIAVAAPDALLVPTIFDADRKRLREIAEESRALAARVRDGSIPPSALSGATFTVSNLGMFGIDSFSAVINQPQAAILTVGSLRRRPIVDQDSDELTIRPTVHLSLACDHRILYGADGARFLARVRELLEQPLAFLL